SATRSHVERLLASARKRSGTCDNQLTLFDNLQSFALRAPREFVEAVLESPRIASAMANQQPENMLIEPTSPTLPAGNTLAIGRSQGNAPRAEETRRSARTATRRPRRTPPAQ
ncbi:MAG: hypothetical protein ACKOJF_06650, partial [Planctomycetaceae bacterium]